MKVILQGFEPMQQPAPAHVEAATARPRKSRIRFQPISIDQRLFHAFTA